MSVPPEKPEPVKARVVETRPAAPPETQALEATPPLAPQPPGPPAPGAPVRPAPTRGPQAPQYSTPPQYPAQGPKPAPPYWSSVPSQGAQGAPPPIPWSPPPVSYPPPLQAQGAYPYTPYPTPYPIPPPYGAQAGYGQAAGQGYAPYGAPQAYGYPPSPPSYGYYPSYGIPYTPIPPGYHTYEGLRYLRYATYGMIAFNLLSLLSNLVLIAAVGQLRSAIHSGSLGALNSAEASLNGATALFGIGALIGLGSGIGALSGMAKLSKGAAAFGAEHKRSVARGNAAIALAVLCYIIIGLLNLTSNSSIDAALESPNASAFGPALDSALDMQILTSLIGLLAAILAGAGMVSFGSDLMTDRGRRTQNTFLVLSVTGPMLVLLVSLAAPGMLGSVSLDIGSSQSTLIAEIDRLLEVMFWLAAVPALANLITVGALSAYVRMVESADEGAHNMVRSGVFDPDAASPPSWSPSAYGAAPAATSPSQWQR